MKDKIYHKQQLLNDIFAVKRYSKGLLIQIKEEGAYKLKTNKPFIEDEDSPFEKNRSLYKKEECKIVESSFASIAKVRIPIKNNI